MSALALHLLLGAAVAAEDLTPAVEEQSAAPPQAIIDARVQAVNDLYEHRRLVLLETDDGYTISSAQLGQFDTVMLAARWGDLEAYRYLQEDITEKQKVSWMQLLLGARLGVAAVAIWGDAIGDLPGMERHKVDRRDYRSREDYLYARQEQQEAWARRLGNMPQAERMAIENKAWTGVYLFSSGVLAAALASTHHRAAKARAALPHLRYDLDEAERRLAEHNEELMDYLISLEPDVLEGLVPPPVLEDEVEEPTVVPPGAATSQPEPAGVPVVPPLPEREPREAR